MSNMHFIYIQYFYNDYKWLTDKNKKDNDSIFAVRMYDEMKTFTFVFTEFIQVQIIYKNYAIIILNVTFMTKYI